MRNNIADFKILISTTLLLLFVMPALVLAQVQTHSASPVQVINDAAEASAVTGANSLNWSGYVSDKGMYTAVSGSWIVPTVSNSSQINNQNGADATWVGIGGVLSHDLIQAGTEAVPDSSGSIDYQAWYELLPSGSVTVPLTVNPGDSITANIAQQSGTADTWLITITDTTTGKSYSKAVSYISSLSSAEWIEEMPAGVGTRISLDDFGTVNFTNAMTTENGSSVSISGSNAQALMMANGSDQALAVPSVLASDGESFSVSRTDAASNSIGIGNFTGRSGYVTISGNSAGYGNPSVGTSTQITPNVTVSYGNGGGAYSYGYGSSAILPPRYRMSRTSSRSYSINGANGIISVVIGGYSRF